jgi:hypothetical protein
MWAALYSKLEVVGICKNVPHDPSYEVDDGDDEIDCWNQI